MPRTRPPMTVITARLPQTQHAEVRRRAAVHGERPSDLVRRAIAEALAQRPAAEKLPQRDASQEA